MTDWKPILDLDRISDKVDEAIDNTVYPIRQKLINSLKELDKVLKEFFPTPLVFKVSLINDLKNLSFKVQLVEYPKGFKEDEDSVIYATGNLVSIVEDIFSETQWEHSEYFFEYEWDKNEIICTGRLVKKDTPNITTVGNVINDDILKNMTDLKSIQEMLEKWAPKGTEPTKYGPTFGPVSFEPQFEEEDKNQFLTNYNTVVTIDKKNLYNPLIIPKDLT